MFTIYLATASGVAISVVLPLIRSLLPKPPEALQPGDRSWWTVARPYIATAIFSLIIAALLLAFLDNLTWRTGLLAGYTADSTLQKITTGNAPPSEGR